MKHIPMQIYKDGVFIFTVLTRGRETVSSLSSGFHIFNHMDFMVVTVVRIKQELMPSDCVSLKL